MMFVLLEKIIVGVLFISAACVGSEPRQLSDPDSVFQSVIIPPAPKESKYILILAYLKL